MDQAGGPQGVVVDGTVSVDRDGRLDGRGHLVGELVRAFQQPPGDRRYLFRQLCFVTIRSSHSPNLAKGHPVSHCARAQQRAQNWHSLHSDIGRLARQTPSTRKAKRGADHVDD